MMRRSTAVPPWFAVCVVVLVWSCRSGASQPVTCGGTGPRSPVQGWSITAQGDVNLNCGDFANKEELRELEINLASRCSGFKLPDVEDTACTSALEGTLKYDGAAKRIIFCNGQEWQTLAIDAASGKGLSHHNPAMSCREIYLSGFYGSGLYWIRTGRQNAVPTQVWCEMEFSGGGWLRVFNMMAKPETAASATEMYNIITRNGPVQAVFSNITSTAITTQGLDLGGYHEVVYGWAKSSDDVVSHYGYYRDDLGLKGHCYIDGYCGDYTVVATMTSSVTKEAKEIKTGSDPSYPHVGLGWTTQQITWGYDLNTSPHGHWANWYTSSCCLTGNTADIRDAGSNWRYSILIR